MDSTENFIRLGLEIYRPKTFQDYRRLALFTLRAFIHGGQMRRLREFFQSSADLRRIADRHPCVYEQATRNFFHRHSSFARRIELIQSHFSYLRSRFTWEALKAMYIDKRMLLWEETREDSRLRLELGFHDGQKKEGLLSIMLWLDRERVDQLIFLFAPDEDGIMSCWIGALQGSSEGKDSAKRMTRLFYGYRPKNLMIHALRTLIAQLGLSRIYAVSNAGYYSNNRILHKRCLKTSLDDFWREIGGRLCEDERFFTIPVDEPRKTLEELPSRKRNLYRKRFAALDALGMSIGAVLLQALISVSTAGFLNLPF
jgi:uncharacterized protein